MQEFNPSYETVIHQQDPWRLFRIISEFVQSFDTFHAEGPFVSIFGSSRLTPTNQYYPLAREVSSKIAQKGFSIVTGAGPGFMEAANKSAQEAHQGSAGLVPILPYEQPPNPYVDPKLCVQFRYFFVRKVTFVRYSEAFVFLPGGYGTLDELFEILTLVQTKRIQNVPIFLMGSTFWEGMLRWMREQMVHEGCIYAEEMNLFTVTDDPERVASEILENYRTATKRVGKTNETDFA